MPAPAAPLILIVEDEPNQREMLVRWLASAAYRVHACGNARELIRQRALLLSASCVLLDWNLPDMPGDDLLHWLHNQDIDIPVIFHTVHDCEEDVVSILNAGADDYLIKPSQKNVLLARVRAVLRRRQQATHPQDRLHIGSVHLNRLLRTIAVDNQRLELNDKEFGIAWELALCVGKVLLREKLLAVVWGLSTAIESRTVDMYVSRLRSILKSMGVEDWKIRPVYGIGYRLDVLPAPSPASPTSAA